MKGVCAHTGGRTVAIDRRAGRNFAVHGLIRPLPARRLLCRLIRQQIAADIGSVVGRVGRVAGPEVEGEAPGAEGGDDRVRGPVLPRREHRDFRLTLRKEQKRAEAGVGRTAPTATREDMTVSPHSTSSERTAHTSAAVAALGSSSLDDTVEFRSAGVLHGFCLRTSAGRRTAAPSRRTCGRRGRTSARGSPGPATKRRTAGATIR